MNEKIRCRKCCGILLSENKICLRDAHGEECHDTAVSESESSVCPSVREHSCLYISEESFPDFILQAVEESMWTKGKIYCPSCQARLGSFNFVSGSQCACGAFVLPHVHLMRSKVDWMKGGDVNPHPVSFPNCPVSLCAATLPLDDPALPAQGEAKDGVSPNATRSSSDHDAAASTTQTTSFRSQKTDGMDVLEKPKGKVRERKKSGNKHPLRTSAAPPHESREGSIAAKSSCFEVLEDELTATEDDADLEDDVEERNIPDNLVCPVCLDVLFSPLVTKPCGHIFCEPCLRRMARPNPTRTHCPLCRRIIGQCISCPELALDVQNCFSSLYQKRRQFELQHNSQHLPLPWTRNFRFTNAYHSGENWLERLGGWYSILLILSSYILGVGIMLYLGKAVKIQSNLNMGHMA